jgi:coenzyme F420-reducing hydrogenase beta subunit
VNKVGVMTWFTYNNYGTVLQAYALSKKIEDMQLVPEIINYRPKVRKTNIYDMTPKYILSQLTDRGYKRRYNLEISKINKKFDQFRIDDLHISEEYDTYTQLKEKADGLNKVVCGSDQIWSPIFFDSHYYLDFVEDDSKKISYAPSFGVSSVNNEQLKEKIKKLLSKFNNISVREEQGKKIIKEICNKDVEVVLDPTLLLTKEEWNNSFKIESKANNYILCYFLGNNKKYIKIAKEMSRKLKLPLKVILINNLINCFDKSSIIFNCGPKEFVEYISNAAYVLTDSYHGVLFAINFNKPFVALKRFKENKFSQNSRVFNILKTFDLENRLYNDKKINLTEIQYETVNAKLDKKRRESIDFLRNSLFNEKVGKRLVITNNCTGCGVCAAICPKECISIRKNENGFYAYTVDSKKCIKCGLCKRNCGQVHNNATNIGKQKMFSAYSKSNEVLKRSSSGGLAFQLTKQALTENKPVIGCTYNYENNRAEHILIDSENNIDELSGSKYLQSYTVDAFKKIKDLKCALIIGTPCQIATIDNYLKSVNKRDKFILVDLICHGVPSYLLWDKFKKECTINKEIKFRDKQYGWKTEMTIDSKRVKRNKFYDYFESGLIYNECCYDCNYREYMASDIRLGDFWGRKSKVGISKVIINTKAGMEIFEKIKDNIIYQEENIAECFNHQQRKNVAVPLERYSIINELKTNNDSLAKISKKYCKKIIKDSNFRNRFYKIYKILKGK